MSVTVQQILGLLQAVAPPALALDWDNVGLLVDAGTPVDSVLTTLDITPAVVREAVENDCPAHRQPSPGHLPPHQKSARRRCTRAADEKWHLCHLYAHEPGCRTGRRQRYPL